MGAGTEPVTERVIYAVVAKDDRGPLELPPLHGSVDPDALETCANRIDHGEISFQYAGYTVTVESDGVVTVTDPHVDENGRIDVATN